MKIKFLGTGSSHGIPVIGCSCNICLSDDAKDKRLRSSLLIETNNQNLIIDAGPDFRQQMLQSKTNRLNAVLLTHEHKDHTAGLDDLRAFNYLMQKPMSIYGEKRVLESIKGDYSYVFAETRYPGSPEFDLHEITTSEFSINGDHLIPIRMFHNELPILGYRINDMAYLTDLRRIPEEEFAKLSDLKVLVISALRIESHVSHIGLPEALELIEKINPKKAYLTHISHRQHSTKKLYDILPSNIEPAYDGLIVAID